ncbi:STAS domain-containing protein [Nonomuraea fastidiosa]|uniref:STAS domain-containing protein n=1 Tax=Nonomuraea fastidiosa TaxID=46173 RepID=UPI00366F376D
MHPSEPGIHESAPDFDIRLDRQEEVVLLSLTGRLEGVACLILQQYLVNALVARIPPLIVVDLRELAAVDEHGRDVLRSAARHARVSDGRLIVIPGDGIAGHGHAGERAGIEVAESVDDALAELACIPRRSSG